MFLANKYINTLNAIKVAYNSRLNTVIVPYNKLLINLLNKFVDINYVVSYTIQGSSLVIKLHDNKIVYWKNAKIVSTPSKKFHISYKKLHLLTRYDFSTIVILHTSQGLLTSHQAIKNKIGGQLLFVFFS